MWEIPRQTGYCVPQLARHIGGATSRAQHRGAALGTGDRIRARAAQRQARSSTVHESSEPLSFRGGDMGGEPGQEPIRVLGLPVDQETLGYVKLLCLAHLLSDHGQDTLLFLFQMVVLGDA